MRLDLPSTKVRKVKPEFRLLRCLAAPPSSGDTALARGSITGAARLSAGRPRAAPASGCRGAGAARELPTSNRNWGRGPLFSSPSTSLIRSTYLSRTQSTTKRLGAKSVNSPPSSEAVTCNGRIHMLNCWDGSSSSSRVKQRFQSSSDTSPPLPSMVNKTLHSIPPSGQLSTAPGTFFFSLFLWITTAVTLCAPGLTTLGITRWINSVPN